MTREVRDSIALERKADSLCDDFERALQASEKPLIERYLTSVDEPDRPRLLNELLRIEFAYFNSAGAKAPIAEYLDRFSDHVDVVKSAHSSIYDAPSQRPAPAADAAIDNNNGEGSARDSDNHEDPVRFSPRRFGDYELLAEVARGGMGVVYRARQTGLDRVVALKMILPAYGSSPEAIERFHTEVRMAGRLDHPAIVPIYEVGSHDGELFFTMRFIDGLSLEDQLKSQDLPECRQAADLVRRCARAVQFAHDNGVIHRDLKPANILVDRQGQPHITDFGLAKLLGQDSGLTRTGHIVGTPGYMAPEQASGKHNVVGVSADVYALGAVLYHQLTGRPPFRSGDALDTVKQVINDEPIRPRQINASVDRDLETICLTCLEKEPSRRFRTAGALAEDLARWMAGEPILTRPISGIQRGIRWCRRNRSTVTIVSLVFALAAGALGSLWYFSLLQNASELASTRHREAEARAELQTAKTKSTQELANVNEYHAIISRVTTAIAKPYLGWKSESLEDLRRAAAIDTSARNVEELRNLAASCLGEVDLRHLKTIVEGDYHAFCAKFSPDGNRIALAGHGDIGKASVRFYSVSAGALEKEVWYDSTSPDRRTGARSMAYSPDGKWLIIGAADGMLHAIDTASYEKVSWQAHEDMVTAVAVHPVEKLVASCSKDKRVSGWSLGEWGNVFSKELSWPCADVAFTPNGETFACVISTGVCYFHVSELVGSNPSMTFDDSAVRKQIAFNPHSNIEASSTNAMVILREIALEFDPFVYTLRDPRLDDLSHADPLSHLEFSPNGQLLASSAQQLDYKLWEVCSRRVIANVSVFSLGNVFPTYSPDGTHFAVVTDSRVDIYDVDGLIEQRPFTAHPYQVRRFDFAPDGSTLVCLTVDQNHDHDGRSQVTVWDMTNGQLLHCLDSLNLATIMHNESFDVCFDSTGDQVLLTDSRSILKWDFQRVIRARLPNRTRRVSLEFIGDGSRCVGTHNRAFMSWNTADLSPISSWSNDASKERVGHSSFTDIAISEQAVFVSSRDSSIKLFDTDSFDLIDEWATEAPAFCVAINSDRSLVASGTQFGGLQINRRQDGARMHLVQAHPDQVNAVAFSSTDRNLLTSASKNGNVVLWHVSDSTIEKLITLPSLTGRSIDSMQFTPDGQKLGILVFGETSIRLWDINAVRAKLAEMGLDW